MNCDCPPQSGTHPIQPLGQEITYAHLRNDCDHPAIRLSLALNVGSGGGRESEWKNEQQHWLVCASFASQQPNDSKVLFSPPHHKHSPRPPGKAFLRQRGRWRGLFMLGLLPSILVHQRGQSTEQTSVCVVASSEGWEGRTHEQYSRSARIPVKIVKGKTLWRRRLLCSAVGCG